MRVLRAFTAALTAFASVVSAAPLAKPGDLQARGGGSDNVDPHRPFAAKFGSSGNSYPVVMVLIHYFGGISSNLVGLLRQNGYTVYQPKMGPISSNWERACEVYAQLTGSVVDYGVARAKMMGHSRFGEDFTGKALYPEFAADPQAKITMMGHSMGGPTGRMFISLMRYGFQAEVDAAIAANTTVSPLFWTNRTDSQVAGFVSIAGVLGGSTFDDYLRSNGLFSTFVIKIVELLIGADHLIPNLYDFQLGHWGLDPSPGEPFLSYITRLFSSSYPSVPSNGLFDLGVQGTRDPLLSWVRNAPECYYFSVAALTTYQLGGVSLPLPRTNAILQPFSTVMGTYSNASLHLQGGDEAWRPNDGQVSVVSARGDSSGYNEYRVDMTKPTRHV
ncbi:hypothetical protein HK101_005732, partial [Irineochytrium annulatum]